MAEERSRDKSIGWYLFLVLGVLILAIAGYTGYVLYPRFHLPAASGIGLSLLAAMAGIASFFSPCSFPLLLTLLARETGKEGSKDQPVRWKVFRFAAALSLGASLFLIGTGLVIAAGGAVLFSGVTFASPTGRLIRTVVGAFLIGLGLTQRGVFRVSFEWVYQLAGPILKTQAKIRHERPVLGFLVFGFGYLLAGFG